MTSELRSNDSLLNTSWKDNCIKLLEEVGVENSNRTQESKEQTNNLLMEQKRLENEIKLIEEETKIAYKQLEALKNDGNDKPISSSILKLYNIITKLTIAIESPANEVKGYIGGISLETFQFDTAKHSQQFIIDNLWNLIQAQLKSNNIDTAEKRVLSDLILNSIAPEQIKRPKLL